MTIVSYCTAGNDSPKTNIMIMIATCTGQLLHWNAVLCVLCANESTYTLKKNGPVLYIPHSCIPELVGLWTRALIYQYTNDVGHFLLA